MPHSVAVGGNHDCLSVPWERRIRELRWLVLLVACVVPGGHGLPPSPSASRTQTVEQQVRTNSSSRTDTLTLACDALPPQNLSQRCASARVNDSWPSAYDMPQRRREDQYVAELLLYTTPGCYPRGSCQVAAALNAYTCCLGDNHRCSLMVSELVRNDTVVVWKIEGYAIDVLRHLAHNVSAGIACSVRVEPVFDTEENPCRSGCWLSWGWIGVVGLYMCVPLAGLTVCGGVGAYIHSQCKSKTVAASAAPVIAVGHVVVEGSDDQPADIVVDGEVASEVLPPVESLESLESVVVEAAATHQHHTAEPFGGAVDDPL